MARSNKDQKEAFQRSQVIPIEDTHTWDSMQGLQRRGVIVVFTRTGEGWTPGQTPQPLTLDQKIGFLWDVRRLCMATSRASDVMILIASRELLTLTTEMKVIL